MTETECVYCAVRSTFYVLPTQCIYVFCLDLRDRLHNSENKMAASATVIRYSVISVTV
jgi:hypothetical protein